MKKILIICILFLINGCSTYVEEAINAEFTPLTPSFEEFKKYHLQMVQSIVEVLLDFFHLIEGRTKLEIF